MKITLVDQYWRQLLPLTFTRPMAHLRAGMHTIGEWWEQATGQPPGVLTAPYLHRALGLPLGNGILVNSALLPTRALTEAISNLKTGQVLYSSGQWLAAHCEAQAAPISEHLSLATDLPWLTGLSRVELKPEPVLICRPADLWSVAQQCVVADQRWNSFPTLAVEKNYVQLLGEALYVHPEATIRCSTVNTLGGPVLIDAGAEVMEGCNLRGPIYIGRGTVIKMGTRIYGATAIGAHCKIGGEVSNSIFHDYSNKGHDGFVGNSVIGSWCNLGADTNTSNLKNTYGAVQVWDYHSRSMRQSGRQFHGLVMGDHAKSGINTMFNTGTVVGVSANVFGSGFPPKLVPSFSWGSAGETYEMARAAESAARMMERRNLTFANAEQQLFEEIFALDHPKTP